MTNEQPIAAWEREMLEEQYRRDTAAAVLRAMDVDEYLIEAVENARPSRPVRRWWVTDNWLRQGGRRLLGPFVDGEEAGRNRKLLEDLTGSSGFFIDSDGGAAK